MHPFHFQKGPIFNNLLLADEVNRAPAKVQSALLEGMAEHQVSIGRETYQLPDLFLVMATQNPIEQGRDLPSPRSPVGSIPNACRSQLSPVEQEREILKLARDEVTLPEVYPEHEVNETTVFRARKDVTELHMADPIEKYIVNLVTHSRSGIPEIAYGASPRATVALDLCARCNAWLNDRDWVSPEDVQDSIHDVLRHRLILTLEAEARGTQTREITDRLLNQVIVL